MSEDPVIDLLIEIRDLLRPISNHYQPEYREFLANEKESLKVQLARKVTGKKSRDACRLMDGSRSQAEIIKECGILKGQLSTLISDLRKEGLLAEGRNPCLVLALAEVEEAFQ